MEKGKAERRERDIGRDRMRERGENMLRGWDSGEIGIGGKEGEEGR